jgi:NAD(P)-dependent dehydrogenase (short-subunit alcohol dehydrogenase family)
VYVINTKTSVQVHCLRLHQAAGGIGQGAANCLAAAGASTIFFVDINLPRTEQAAEESKKYATSSSYTAHALHVDVSKAASVDELLQKVLEMAERIDYLINAAGIDTEKYTTVPDIDLDDYDRVMDVNARGMMLVSRAVTKAMLVQQPRTFTNMAGSTRELSRGVIVNVTSAMSYGVIPGKIAYATSKHAALGITKSFGKAPTQITITNPPCSN